MKLFKFSSILILSLLCMCACVPKLSAKHHHYKSSSTKFSFNLNLGALLAPSVCQTPTYVERTTVVHQPAPVVQTIVTQPTYQPYYQQVIVERPVIQQPVFVERSVIVERPVRPIYLQPQVSYYNSWGVGVGY